MGWLPVEFIDRTRTGQGHSLVKAIHLMGALLFLICLQVDSILFFGDDCEAAVHDPPLERYIVYRFILALQRLFDISSEDLQFATISNFRHLRDGGRQTTLPNRIDLVLILIHYH